MPDGAENRWQFSRLTRRVRGRIPSGKADPLDPRRSPQASRPTRPPDALAEFVRGRAERLGSPWRHRRRGRGIAGALRNVPASPGVYACSTARAMHVRRQGAQPEDRVQNYTHPAGRSNRLRGWWPRPRRSKSSSLPREAEALLLECNLIKP